MATTFYAKQSKASCSAFAADLARFLINDLGGFTGPAWTIIDTYSGAAGTPHEVPGDATDMDSLAADNTWRTNAPAVGDYIILQSASAANKFQVGIEVQSTTLLRFIIAPTGGFSTVADNADMTTAGNWANTILTTFDYTVEDAASNYSVKADADHFMVFFDGAAQKWSYIGKVDTTTTHTGDDAPVVYYSTEQNVYMEYTTGVGTAWKRLSAVDDTTEITCGVDDHIFASSGFWGTSNDAVDAASGELTIWPFYLACNTAGHKGVIGKLIGVYGGSESVGLNTKGTLNSQTYAFCSNSVSYSPIIWEWDGLTVL